MLNLTVSYRLIVKLESLRSVSGRQFAKEQNLIISTRNSLVDQVFKEMEKVPFKCSYDLMHVYGWTVSMCPSLMASFTLCQCDMHRSIWTSHWVY
jgi:hypothetical protein